ncbi:MAG: hypothetical protein V4592_07895 [Bacteroidota bacterium]
MHFIPLFKVRDMRAAIRHYTEVLDFRITWPEDTPNSPVVDLDHQQMELQITTHESERLLNVRACTQSYWTKRRSPDGVVALLAAGASVAGVPFPWGYAAIDHLREGHP